jgi:hypothetical protein
LGRLSRKRGVTMGKHVLVKQKFPLMWKIKNLKNRFFFGIVVPLKNFVMKIR